MPFPTILQIDAERLYLRPVQAEDLPALWVVNGDAEVTRYLPYDTWQSLEDGQVWLTRMQAVRTTGTGEQLVVVRRSDQRVIGSLLLFRYDETHRRIELGYALGRDHWRQGLMTEAVRATCAYVFGSLGIRRIEAEVNPNNQASCAVLLRSGFVLEGRLRQRWLSNGEPYDTDIYGCLATEWLTAVNKS